MLTKGRIAVLSPLAAANGFVRTWLHVISDRFDLRVSAPKWHLDRFTRFCTAQPCDKIADLSPACRAVIEDLMTSFAAMLYTVIDDRNNPFLPKTYYI